MPSFLIRLALLIAVAMFALLPRVPTASAQAAAASGGESELAATIREAAESGVSVVVIDSAGNLIAGAAAKPAAGEPPEQGEQGSALMRAQSEVSAFRETLSSRLAALPYSQLEVAYILRATSPDGTIMAYVKVLAWNLLFLALGYIATVKFYGPRLVRNLVVSRVRENPQGYREKMPFLVFRFVMGIGGTLFCMVFALIVGFLVFGTVDDLSIQFTVTSIFAAFFLARTVSDLWRMVLSPFLSQYRIPVFSDRDARRLYYWASFIATYDIVTVMFATWVGDFGLNYNVYALVYGVLTLVGAGLNMLCIVFNGRAISSAIRAGRAPAEVPWLTRMLSVAWAPLVVGYIVFAWLELAFDLVLEREISIPLMAGFYMVLMSIIVVYGVINFGIERYFDRRRRVEEINADNPDGGEHDETPDGGHRGVSRGVMTFEELARRVAGILAFGVGSLALIRIWRPEMVWVEDSWNDRVLDIAVIMFIGYVVYHFFRIWIDSKIAEETVDEAEGELGDEGGEAGASRLATLLPLFRGAILAVVVVSIILIALMEAGINVSPLFAGAGVVGLAVGFGSQTLVRDIFSGAFFLLDDAFRKGEYIDIGDVKGTVEKISVRSFQLRHHLGALNTIPFGEIRVLTNYSRDWVIMKLPLRVTYDTDVEKVRKLIKKLGQELLNDPVIGDNFIQPLKSQGVIEMQDSAMIIRVKFMTKPGDQWLVRKKVYEEIRALFEREGIHFAHREVTVRLADGSPDNLSPQQKEAVTGAVQAAIDEDYLDDIGPGGDDR